MLAHVDRDSRNFARAFPWVAHAQPPRTGCQRFKEETATSHDSLAPGVDCGGGGGGGVGQMYLPPSSAHRPVPNDIYDAECARSVGRSVGMSKRVQGDRMGCRAGKIQRLLMVTLCLCSFSYLVELYPAFGHGDPIRDFAVLVINLT